MAGTTLGDLNLFGKAEEIAQHFYDQGVTTQITWGRTPIGTPPMPGKDTISLGSSFDLEYLLRHPYFQLAGPTLFMGAFVYFIARHPDVLKTLINGIASIPPDTFQLEADIA